MGSAGATLVGADLGGAQVVGAKFNYADIQSADFAGVSFQDSEFYGAQNTPANANLATYVQVKCPKGMIRDESCWG